MSSSFNLSSVIAAAASSVGKTFLIGATGFICTKFPRSNPLIPSELVSPLSRLTFAILILPMIYVGVGSSVQVEDLDILYPIVLASFVIISISYITTVLLGYMFRLQKERFFIPLCVAGTFPNIVALPIIIYPTLCEYPALQEIIKDHLFKSYISNHTIDQQQQDYDDLFITTEYNLKEECQVMTDAIVFSYFFGFSILFWSIGHRSLVSYRTNDATNTETEDMETYQCTRRMINKCMKVGRKVIKAIWDIFKSPGFALLILGFITACIPPLQDALFQDAGVLRVFGSTLDSLAKAGGTFATIVVAASLASKSPRGMESNQESSVVNVEESLEMGRPRSEENQNSGEILQDKSDDIGAVIITKKASVAPIDRVPRSSVLGRMYRYSIVNFARSIQIVDHVSLKIHFWQCISRLVITPTVVFVILLKMECSGVVPSINAVCKIVLLINSSCPGALVAVVILKAQGYTDAASAVSKTYLPMYSISVITMALWASLGLVAFRTDSSFCKSI